MMVSIVAENAMAGGVRAGVAKVDVTPEVPIRLSGYGNRMDEAEVVAQPLWAKALAFRGEDGKLAVLVTVDNCAVPETIRQEILERLRTDTGLVSERFALCSTHTHTAPCLTDAVPNLFGRAIPDDHQARIDRYTRKLVDSIETAVRRAIGDLRPARLSFGQGQAGFAKNRRTEGGPVLHDLPVLKVTAADGELRALLVGYACHCTTLNGGFNQVCGDWAGYAQEYLEAAHPGAIAAVAIGCGADSNPHPRTGLNYAQQHGHSIADEVNRLLKTEFRPLPGMLRCRIKRLHLPYDPLPSREQWEERAGQEGIVGYHAQRNLARLDRGEALPTALPYLVQSWSFGDELAMVFLAGEVVVDYALRLRREFDPSRLWVSAYTNDVPCYIPSRRILQEGGYEAEGAMRYFDRPTRLAPDVEEMIVGAVHKTVPDTYKQPLSGE